MEFKFDGFVEVMDYFKNIINVFRQMNYAEYKSEQFYKFNEQLDNMLTERADN
jgi:V/A-type H+-transporting ATPase subunit A